MFGNLTLDKNHIYICTMHTLQNCLSLCGHCLKSDRRFELRISMVHYLYKVFWPRTQLSSASVLPLCVSFVKMPSCYPKHHIHGSVDLIDKLKGETPDPAGRERVRTSSIIDCLKWHNGSYNIDVKNSTNVSSATWI